MNVTTGIPINMFIREARLGKRQMIESVVRTLEELGFWGIAVPDHILSAGVAHVGHERETQQDWRYADPLTLLAYLASMTTMVRLMTRVLVVPYRQPFAVAHALATVDSLSAGRLVFSFAAGYERVEFATMRVPRDERGPITDEYLDIILGLWANDQFSYKGKYYSFDNAHLLIPPVQRPHPPLWVGGNGKLALRRAVRMGDAWTPNGFVYPEVDKGVPNGLTLRQFSDAVTWSSRERKKADQPPLDYAMSSGPPLKLLEQSQRGAPRPRSSIDRFTCVGTPDELIEEYLAFKAAGATSWVVNFSGATPEEYLKDAATFTKRIMPALG